MRTLIFTSCFLLVSMLAMAAGSKKEDDVDHLSLAALLIETNNYERAAKVLQQVDTKEKDLDLPRYHVLSGLVYLEMEHYPKAGVHFEKALQLGTDHAGVKQYAIYSWYKAKKCEKALAILKDETLILDESLLTMKVSCLRKTEQDDLALETLHEGQAQFPSSWDLQREELELLLDVDVHETFAERVWANFQKYTESEMTYILKLLFAKKAWSKALHIGEAAMLRWPYSDDIKKTMAHVYMESGNARWAAPLFEELAMKTPELFADAAELYRRSGQNEAALRCVTRIADRQSRAKIRFGILLDAKRFGEAAAMEKILEDEGLLKEADIKYALAWIHYRLLNLERADHLAKEIADPQLFRQATQLRQSIRQCRSEGWQCQ